VQERLEIYPLPNYGAIEIGVTQFLQNAGTTKRKAYYGCQVCEYLATKK